MEIQSMVTVTIECENEAEMNKLERLVEERNDYWHKDEGDGLLMYIDIDLEDVDDLKEDVENIDDFLAELDED